LKCENDQADENIDEEEREDDNKNNEIDGNPYLVVQYRTLILVLAVNSCLHNTDCGDRKKKLFYNASNNEGNKND